jgi:hypothetical protein
LPHGKPRSADDSVPVRRRPRRERGATARSHIPVARSRTHALAHAHLHGPQSWRMRGFESLRELLGDIGLGTSYRASQMPCFRASMPDPRPVHPEVRFLSRPEEFVAGRRWSVPLPSRHCARAGIPLRNDIPWRLDTVMPPRSRMIRIVRIAVTGGLPGASTVPENARRPHGQIHAPDARSSRTLPYGK